jgi:hypothetical protein
VLDNTAFKGRFRVFLIDWQHQLDLVLAELYGGAT